MLLWASGFPATELLLEQWHPLVLTPFRLGLGGLILLLLLALAGRLAELRMAPWRDIWLVGGFGLGAHATLLVFALAYADPVMVAIIATTVPLVSAIMGLIAGEERLRPRLVAAIGLAIAGGLVASRVFEEDAVGFEGGEILMLVSVVGWTWFSRASVARFAMLSDLGKSAATTLTAGVAVMPVMLLAAATGLIEPRFDASAGSLGLLLWLAGVGIGLSMLLWLKAARMIGVTLAAIHQNLVPFYVMLMAVALGGRFEPTHIAGGVLVVTGALLAQLDPATLTRLRRLLVAARRKPTSGL